MGWLTSPRRPPLACPCCWSCCPRSVWQKDWIFCSNNLWWKIEWIILCQFAMALCDCKVFTPAWGWTFVRPDSVLMMKLILLPQTSSRNPASRILAEAALSSWRRQNFATSADRDTDLQWRFIIRTSGVKLTYSRLFILILVSKITQPRKILHPRLIKYFIPRPG